MKKLKVFYMGQRLRDVYPHATRFQVIKWRIREGLKWILRMFTYGTLGTAITLSVFMAGWYSRPEQVNAQSEGVTVTSQAPIMDRIAGCESEGNPKSKGSHKDKKGNVRINKNSNGTVDVGKNQINSIWFLKAMEMNLNLTDEKDNQTFADYLYANYGTEPWYSSKACWK